MEILGKGSATDIEIERSVEMIEKVQSEVEDSVKLLKIESTIKEALAIQPVDESVEEDTVKVSKIESFIKEALSIQPSTDESELEVQAKELQPVESKEKCLVILS